MIKEALSNTNNRWLIIIFALYCLIGMHWWQDSMGGHRLELPIFAVGWLFICLLIACGVQQIVKNRCFYYSPLIKYSWLPLLCFLIPLLYPNEFYLGDAIFNYLGIIGGLALLIALTQFKLNEPQKRLLLWLLLAAMVIEALVGLAEFFFGFRSMGEDLQRPKGLFNQPNLLASFLATGWVLATWLLLTQERHQQKANIYLMIATVIVVIALITTQSRTGYLALAIAAPLLLFAKAHRQSPLLKKSLTATLLGIALGITALQTTESAEKAVLQDSGRIPIYTQSLQMIAERPLSGYGMGLFQREFLYYHAEQVANGDAEPSIVIEKNLTHPHNEVFYWWIEGGILPVIGLLGFALLALLALLKTQKKKRAFYLAFLIPVLIHSQTEIPFNSSATHWFLLIFGLWLISSEHTQSKSLTSDVANLLRPLQLLLLIFAPLLFITALHTTAQMVKFMSHTPTTTAYLQKIINPYAWGHRLEFLWHAAYVDIGKETNQPELVKPYIEWAEKQVQLTPRHEYYNYLDIAYRTLREQDNAEKTQRKMSFLYPLNKSYSP